MIAMRNIAGLLLAIFVLVGLAQPVMAASPFLVAGIEIDATAQSAADAQGKAQEEGFRLAYQALLDRLVPRADQVRIPRISDDHLAGLIKSFQVTDEKRSSTRYLAKFSVQFKPDQVRYWFRNAGVSFSETSAERTLLLPVWTPAGETPQLWGGLNIWRQAFEKRKKNSSDAVTFILGDGDLDDMQTLDARQALSNDEAAIGTIAARYGVDRYAVIAVRLTATEAVIAYSVNDPFGSRRWNERYPRAVDLDEGAELAALSDAAQIAIDEDWKRQTLIGAMSHASMTVTVPIASLKGWQDVKDRLEATAGVRDVIVREITLTQVLVHISYQGHLSQLQVGLEAQDLRLAADYDGRATLFDLRTQGRAAPR